MSKNMKVYTQLGIGFIIIELLLVISLYTGYTTAAQIITVDDPQHYLGSYATFTAVLFVIMMIVSTGIAVTMTRKIRLACADLKNAADGLAAGKVDMKLEKRNNDEFGELMDEFQKVVDNMRYQAQVAQEVADGNMTVDVKLLSEEDVLGIALRKLVQGNHQAISAIKESAYQVTTSSSQVASASEALAQGSTEQASAIEQITASIADVAAKTRENASKANNAEELILQAIEDVKKGNTEMQEMVVAMQDINKASESISKIIKVIDDIAFQTNILALNAAVEAARAGEAGKGFAVVAEEVRNLAAKSASAAAETAELIEDSIQKVEAGSQIANDTAAALEEITQVVQKSEAIITDIAEASNYQATAIAQIDQAVEQVSQVVQTNSATSEECAAASAELSNQASKVRDMLSVYKLHEYSQMSRGMNGGAAGYMSRPANTSEQIISLNDSFGKY
ncbi:MAG: methyl-accepting chemotaxis protein [Lachnospiraceae bacterium]|nr:methyl-accepting chemotaxis protein [Lachnospiraceae bacterium]